MLEGVLPPGVELRKKLIAKLGHAINENDAYPTRESKKAIASLNEQIKRTNVAFGFNEYFVN